MFAYCENNPVLYTDIVVALKLVDMLKSHPCTIVQYKRRNYHAVLLEKEIPLSGYRCYVAILAVLLFLLDKNVY